VTDQKQDWPRVVITGLGAITAQGTTAEDLWQGVKAGRVAIRPVQNLSMEGLRTEIGGEVQDMALPEHDYRRPEGFRDRAHDFALKAAEEAMENSGISFDQVPSERWGIVVGTCNAGLISGEEWYKERMEGKTPDPSLLCLVTPQAVAESLSGAFGIKGPVLSIDTACAAGANAIGYAAELIRTGKADAVLAGGTDAFSDVLYAGFNSLESLSPKPAAPYSKNREGLSLGEGSGMVVLVREDVARKAGATELAELVGYGLSADGYHPTAPHPEGLGASRAVKQALRAGGLAPDEVNYVNSHGTGTPKNDPAETKATRRGLGDEAAEKVAVSSTKSMIGHLLGAAGAAEAIVTIRAITDQVAPPTANYEEPDPECDLDYVPNTARETPINVAVSNNFAFGGANASIALSRPDYRSEAPPAPAVDRVVVTGLATLTSCGTDPQQVWNAFAAGTNCLQEREGVKIGCVDLDPSAYLSGRERRRVDRLGIFSIIASKLALQDSGVEVSDEKRDRIGVIFGTGVGPMESMENFARPLFEEGPAAANPAVFPNTVYNAAAGQVAMQVGTVGSATTVTAGHGAGASSICYAFDIAAFDHADMVISIAADTLTDTVLQGYKDLGLLAPDNGFALAEGAVALVLERLSHAQQRAAHIYGEIVGFGIASDAKGVGRFDPRGQGVERAMSVALEMAGLQPGDIKAVWASQSGLRAADMGEEAAIRKLFGDGVTVIAPKKQMGEPMGVGASLNAALALEGWKQGATDKDPSGPILINSDSLGGTHFSIVLVPHAA
jgi:3-oxoacyl-[acyl-carrier-protein] synthase II